MQCRLLAIALVIASGCGAARETTEEGTAREATPGSDDALAASVGGPSVGTEARTVPLGIASAPPPSQVVPICEPSTAREVTRYDELTPDPAVLWYVDARFDPAYGEWLPAAQLDMPLHHASSIRWIDDPVHYELVGARERVLRISFVVLDRQLVRSVHEGLQIDAAYTVDVVAVCEPRAT